MLTAMCIEAANYIINRTNKFNETKKSSAEKIFLSCKRLQKILYFSEIEYMKRHNGRPMFKDEFYAWPSGPVIPSVYDKFVQYQDGTMYPVEKNQHTPITTEMEEVLGYIFDKTEKLSTKKIVDLSHEKTGPWDQVYDDDDIEHKQIIPKQDMYRYYKGRTLFD